jgi:sugar lactone lactonase YvrE
MATIGGPKAGMHWPQGIDVDSRGRIYVANGSGDDTRAVGCVTVYRGGSNGDVAPIAIIRTGTGSPRGIAVDAAGKVYVTRNLFMGDIPVRAFAEPHSITVYRLGSSGDVARIATISGPETDLDGPAAVALDSAGRIHVTNVGGGWNGHPATVTVYPPDADGDVNPIATLTGGPDTGIDLPEGIALDSSGRIYVTNSESVTIYPAGTDHNVRPLATIRGEAARLVGPSGITVDSADSIYVANQKRSPEQPASVTVYRSGADGNVAPSGMITGADIGSNPGGVAVDANGNVYVVSRGDWGKGSIAIYPAGSHGDVPIATVVGEHTGIAGPSGIALDAIGRIYLANEGRPRSDAGSVTVYPSLAKLSSEPGYPDVKPLATIAGTKTALAHPRSIAVDSIGRIYVLQHRDHESNEGPIPVVTEVAGINVYRPLDDREGVHDEAPMARIAGANTGLDMSPSALAVAPVGH